MAWCCTVLIQIFLCYYYVKPVLLYPTLLRDAASDKVIACMLLDSLYCSTEILFGLFFSVGIIFLSQQISQNSVLTCFFDLFFQRSEQGLCRHFSGTEKEPCA